MKKFLKISVILAMSSLFLVGCGDQKQSGDTKETSTSVSISEKETVTASVSVNDGENTTEKSIKATEDESLQEIMKKEFAAKEDGGFITEIDGISQNKEENKYWVFTINGEQVNKGASDVKLKNNDKVEWTLEKF